MAMHDHFEIIPFLRKTLASHHHGRVHIVGEGIEWCLDISNDKLLFAAHSLQYLNTLETILSNLNYEAVLPIYWRLIQLDIYKRHIDHIGLESLNWTSKIVGALIQYNVLGLEQAEKILAKLAQDAVESLLGLEKATVVWHPLPKELWHITTQGIDISSLVHHLSEIGQLWQPLCDRICSPHQRPYCESLDSLYKPIPQGMLPQQMLEALARLMQGASIRQLAQSVKQDEIKLAQLLYPYIEHRIIKLWPPLQPLDRLPWIPIQPQPSVLATSNVSTIPDVVVNNLSTPGNTSYHPAQEDKFAISERRVDSPVRISSDLDLSQNERIENTNSNIPKARCLIVCIDDSQAMLEKIESYLDPKKFEIKSIIDPVKSVSKICFKKPSLVLMDISMPGINGNSLCSILKRSYMFKDVPIIMISSNTSALTKAKSQVSGASGYLEKPFSKADLLTVLDTHLKLNLNKVS